MHIGEETQREKFYQRHIGIAIHRTLGRHSDELADLIRAKWAVADLAIRQTGSAADAWPQLLACAKWLDENAGGDRKWFWEWQTSRPTSDHGIMRFYLFHPDAVLLFKLACG
jgi:hypothetical protein